MRLPLSVIGQAYEEMTEVALAQVYDQRRDSFAGQAKDKIPYNPDDRFTPDPRAND